MSLETNPSFTLTFRSLKNERRLIVEVTAPSHVLITLHVEVPFTARPQLGNITCHQAVMVTKPLGEMKDNTDWKIQSVHDLQWKIPRRPQTAVWRIPKMDVRRETYSKSAKEPVCSDVNQSPGLSSGMAFSFESNVSSQVIDLHTSNGPHQGYCKNGSFTLPMERKLPHIHTFADHTRSNIWDGSSLSLHHNEPQSPQTYLTYVEIKTPWYLTVLQEKERCLLKLGEEINRLSKYEVESKRKDEIISTLKNEISQLQDLQQTSSPHTSREEGSSSVEQMDHVSLHSTNGYPEFDEFSSGRDVTQEALNIPSSHRDLFTRSERNLSTISLAGSFSELHRDSYCPHMENEQSLHDDENLAYESNGENSVQEQTVDFTTELEDHIDGAEFVNESEEKDLILKKLQEELEVMKKDSDISKGVISSLQKAVFSHESKLRKSESEREGLQRELIERGLQLQAMSNKFSSMREEKKHEEMLAATEKENYNLRELVSELKSEVSRRNDLIGDLKNDFQRLQREILELRAQLRKNEEERNQIESKAGDLAASEQDVRVALESFQSRFERFRSKIIQGAYASAGFKGPQAEISDNEVLETMQKIIAERSGFHQQLQQKGIKVPTLHQSETSVKRSMSISKKKGQ